MPEKGLSQSGHQSPARKESGVATVETTQMVASMQMTFQGPLPPAIELEKYNQIVPGAAERIIAMAEKQTAHRMELEKHAVAEQLRQSARGQLFALIIGVTGIIGAVIVGLIGNAWVAGTIATAALGTLAVSFISGKRQEQQTRQQKVR
jgi:uncharacterized membrane protein